MHSLVALSKKAIHEYVVNREIISPLKDDLTDEMKKKAGVFVSLKKHGQLRGCIGTFSPTTEDIAHEIIRNAIAAATEDPRFNPVRPDELDDLTYSVDVLSEPEKVEDISELDEKKYGVIVSSGFRRGLLLPDLEGVDSPAAQLEIAKQKAGIDPNESDVEMFRFEVKRYY